ncbi:MAG TPA: serine hydroxymethyltransferase [Gammaproteobacteria bacterium]
MSDMPALKATDAEIYALIHEEERRQDQSIRLIASENYASSAVMEATGSVLANKYSEGYPGHRYYEGQQYVDQIEALAIERAKALFGAAHANVQPYSGSPANQAVYMALLKPGDTVMGLGLPFGGHLTHGWNVNFSGILYNAVQYDVDAKTHRVDLNKVEDLARRARPKMIMCGGTAYPRVWDFAGFAAIASSVGATLVADIAHIAGLVVAGAHPHPFPHAHIITTTTHKTLRGPRGGMILSDGTFAKEIDRAVFPGLQGGPHDHTTAAIAVALKEAATPEFKRYAHQVVANAKALAAELLRHGLRLVSGGTDNHLILIDVTPRGINGKPAARALSKAGIECNYNTVPFDPRKPMDPSGLRIGTPSVTSRGMKEKEMVAIADWIDRVIDAADDERTLAKIRAEIAEFCKAFPAPGIAY